jgi:hypothetical protein
MDRADGFLVRGVDGLERLSIFALNKFAIDETVRKLAYCLDQCGMHSGEDGALHLEDDGDEK